MKRLIVIGNGMAGGRLLEELVRRGAADRFTTRVFGDEPHGSYNRISLPDLVAGACDASELTLNPLAWYAANQIAFDPGVAAATIDSERRTVTAADGAIHPYDALVIATGSRTAFPDVDGLRGADGTLCPGVFGLRSIDDCAAILAWVGSARRVAVVGGGLLGLEAARALLAHGVEVAVIHRGPHLMNAQLDAGASEALREAVEDLGIDVRLRASTTGILADTRVRGLKLADGTCLAADMVLVATGTRPNTELAAHAGLPVEHGIVVDDTLQVLEHPDTYAIGECAQHRGLTSGLLAPAWDQATVVADRLTAADPHAVYRPSPPVIKLKFPGIELAAMGVTEPLREYDEVIHYSARKARVHKTAIVRDGRLVGATLLGDLQKFPALWHALDTRTPLPIDPSALFFDLRDALDTPETVADLAPDTRICNCNNVSKADIDAAVAAGHRALPAIAAATRATTGCGSCRERVTDVLDYHARAAA